MRKKIKLILQFTFIYLNCVDLHVNFKVNQQSQLKKQYCLFLVRVKKIT